MLTCKKTLSISNLEDNRLVIFSVTTFLQVEMIIKMPRTIESCNMKKTKFLLPSSDNQTRSINPFMYLCDETNILIKIVK